MTLDRAPTPSADTLAALLERVRKAEGYDEDLVRDLCRLWTDDPDYPSIATWVDIALGAGIASIGAAIALVERVFPEANWSVSWGGGKWRNGYIAYARVKAPFSGRSDDEKGFPNETGRGRQPSLALLDALLSALLARIQFEEIL